MLAEVVFLDPTMRSLFVDWPAKARAVVGDLRIAVGNYPDDAVLTSLIGMLSMRSTEFASLWADNRVQARATAVYELRHPLVGSLVLTQQTLRSVEHPDQTLVTHTAPAGSAAAEGLVLLTQLVLGAADQDPARAVSRGR